MINLSPFGLPSESKGHICEAPTAATLCWSLDRAGGKTDTSDEGKKQAGLNQTKKHLHSRRSNQQSEKATYKMGEKCSQTMSDKGLLHKIYKEFIQQ